LTKHNEGLSVGLTGVSTNWGRGVDSLTRVRHLSYITVRVVSGVGHSLDPAVGKRDGIGAADVSAGIAGLSGVEVGLGVVVSNTVGVGVRLRGLLNVHNRGSVVGRGSVDNRGNLHNRGRGVVSRGSVHNRGRGMIGRGGMDNRGRGIGGGSVHNRGGVVDGVGHKRGSMDSMVGNCVMGHRGSMMHSMVSHRSSVDKRGSMVDSVRNDGGMGNSMVGNSVVGDRVGNSVVGNRVGDSVDCVVGRHNLAMSAVGHSGGTSVGEVGAG